MCVIADYGRSGVARSSLHHQGALRNTAILMHRRGLPGRNPRCCICGLHEHGVVAEDARGLDGGRQAGAPDDRNLPKRHIPPDGRTPVTGGKDSCRGGIDSCRDGTTPAETEVIPMAVEGRPVTAGGSTAAAGSRFASIPDLGAAHGQA